MSIARFESSERLQNLYNILSDGLWHSGLEIATKTHSLAVHTDAHELRHNGYPVEQRYNGTTRNGRKKSEYRINYGQLALGG